MSSYRDKAGVWAVYDYSEGPRISSVHADVVPAVRIAETYESIMFWPFGMGVDDALKWWNQPEDSKPITKDDRDEIYASVRNGYLIAKNGHKDPDELIDIITDQIITDIYEVAR